MLVRDAMTPHAEWISPDISLTEVALRMRNQHIGCLPVGEKDRLIGMITDRDLACRGVAEGLNPSTAQARQVMTNGITWCFEDETVDEAAQRMEEKQIHHMPVLSRQKRMVGILSLSSRRRISFGAAPRRCRRAAPPFPLAPARRLVTGTDQRHQT